MAMLLLTAACGGGERPSGSSDAIPSEPPDIRWTTVYREGSIRATIEDPDAYYRVQQVTLFDPDGGSYEATEITRETLNRDSTGTVRPSVGVGGGYSSRGGFGTGLGIGLSFPLGGGGSSEAPPEARRTTALLPVADPERYGRTAARWEIQATLASEGGAVSYARFPAPVPGEASR